MKSKQYGDTYLVRIDYGEEIMSSLKEFCAQEHIAMARVEAIGAADHAVIGVYDLGTQTYHQETLDGFYEITSLNGNVTKVSGAPYIHLHATLADQQHGLHGGHVIEMRVGATCEMFVTAIDARVRREKDEGLGINLWKL